MNKFDRKELKGAAESKRFAGSIQEYPDRDTGRILPTRKDTRKREKVNLA